jgi:nucleoside-diphosphate-sugar epimerase
MKILIIGSRGYIGSYIFNNLKEQYDVIGIDILLNNINENNILLDYNDISDEFINDFELSLFGSGVSCTNNSNKLLSKRLHST